MLFEHGLTYFDISGIDWMLGLGIMFGLAFVMTFLTESKELDSFFIWLMVFCGFVVWGGLLPLWVLIFCIILATVVFYAKLHGNSS